MLNAESIKNKCSTEECKNQKAVIMDKLEETCRDCYFGCNCCVCCYCSNKYECSNNEDCGQEHNSED